MNMSQNYNTLPTNPTGEAIAIQSVAPDALPADTALGGVEVTGQGVVSTVLFIGALAAFYRSQKSNDRYKHPDNKNTSDPNTHRD